MVVDNTYQQTKVSEVLSRRLTDKLSIVQFGVARASFENVEIFVAASSYFWRYYEMCVCMFHSPIFLTAHIQTPQKEFDTHSKPSLIANVRLNCSYST